MKQLIIGVDLGLTNLGVSCIDEKEKILNFQVFHSVKGKPYKSLYRRIYWLADKVHRFVASQQYSSLVLCIESPVSYTHDLRLPIIFGRLMQSILETIVWDKLIIMPPLQIKKAFTGNGRADKKQIVKKVKTMTWERNLKDVFTGYDRAEQEAIADAVAIAVAGKRLIGKRLIVDE